ncbi:MAG: T9SS type A sorting domain-containing protein [Saprospiraceae bacterium]
MSKIIYLFVALTISPNAFAQAYDRLWFTGYTEFPGVAGYGHAQIRFENDTVVAEPANLAFNFESTVAVMADSAGELLFYTNGCSIANRNHEIMSNGEGLNPGEISDLVCPQKGYIVPQGAMVLPSPAGDNRYFLIHTGAMHDAVRKLRLGPLYFTEIDMNGQNGLGVVVSKNNILVAGDLGSFTAVRHGNGRDWWIIVPEFSNKTWHCFLLTPEGIESHGAQQVALTGPDCEKFMATAASRDGDKVANWGDCKITVLDFDRCDGQLHKELELPAPTHWIPGGGVAFSASGRYLYATSQNVLFRADLEATDPKPKLDTMRFSYDPYLVSPYDVPGNTFHYLTTGPDGYIYGNIPSRASHLHILKNSDVNSIATLNFNARGLTLPVKGVRTLPHLPNYRLYDWAGSPCDTLGISVAVNNPNQDLCRSRIAPNPATKNSWLTISACPDSSVAIFDVHGREKGDFYIADGAARVSLVDYAPGIYFVTIQRKTGTVTSHLLVILG